MEAWYDCFFIGTTDHPVADLLCHRQLAVTSLNRLTSDSSRQRLEHELAVLSNTD